MLHALVDTVKYMKRVVATLRVIAPVTAEIISGDSLKNYAKIVKQPAMWK